MSEEVRCYRPVSDGWTISEIPEHIALTNYYLTNYSLLILIGKCAAKPRKNLNGLGLRARLASY